MAFKWSTVDAFPGWCVSGKVFGGVESGRRWPGLQESTRAERESEEARFGGFPFCFLFLCHPFCLCISYIPCTPHSHNSRIGSRCMPGGWRQAMARPDEEGRERRKRGGPLPRLSRALTHTHPSIRTSHRSTRARAQGPGQCGRVQPAAGGRGR